MLRKRSRAVGGGKQGLMPDHQPLPSPTGSSSGAKTTACSLFLSPRLFGAVLSDPETAMSPTSILENRHFSSIGNLLFPDRNQKRPPPETAATEVKGCLRANAGARAVGLGILDALGDEQTQATCCNPRRRMVLFGSKLHIQIPSVSPGGSMEFPNSPIEFGIKNKDSQLALFSPARSLGVDMAISPAPVLAGSMSASEMELSEDYTCVITHGPNPRTIHIFDDRVLETFGGDGLTGTLREDVNSSANNSDYHPANEFLNQGCACKKHLGQGENIYVCRGDKAFCSCECRYQEMLLDERLDPCSTQPSLAS